MGTEQRSNPGARLVHGTSPVGAATMRAVQHRYSPSSALESSEVGLPLPGEGDVLARVGAASVHPGDYVVRTGEPHVVRLAFGLREPRLGRTFRARVLSGFTRQQLKPITSVEKRQDLLTLADLLATGQVTPVIDRTYPLDEAADALRCVGAGHTRGRVVITR